MRLDPRRAVVPVLSATLLLEAATYSLLTPLLPDLVRKLGLSTSQAGTLFGVYLLAFTVGVLLGWWRVALLGARLATRLALTLFAASAVGFALVGSYWAALSMRFLAGVAGGVTWVAVLTWLVALSASGNRGKIVGTAFSVALAGTLVGPLIGNAAASVGMPVVLGGMATIFLLLALLLPEDATAVGDAVEPRLQTSRRHVDSRGVAMASVATVAIAVSYGSLFVLLPLRLSDAGVAGSWIGWLFVISAALSAVVNRVAGSAADRRGAQAFSVFSVVGGALLAAVLSASSSVWTDVAAVVLGLGVVLAVGLAPSSADASMRAQRAGFRDVSISVLVVIMYSGGSTVGSFVTPAIAEWLSPTAALATLAIINAVAALVVMRPSSSGPLELAPAQPSP